MAHPAQPTQLPSIPSAADFTPLPDHESATPSSFFGAKPVLHAALGVCDLLIASTDTKKWDVFHALSGIQAAADDATSEPASSTSVEQMQVVAGVGGFVTSSSLILTAAETAISIPYPCISLHATQRLYFSPASQQQPPRSYSTEPSSDQPAQTQAVYLQLDMDPAAREHANPDDGDDSVGADDPTVEILLVPQTQPQVNGTEQPAQESGNEAKVKELFEALSRCADLHPDPSLDDDGGAGGGGLASLLGFAGGAGGMPGEGGWITSENAHEFEGQFGDVDEIDDDEDAAEATEEANGLGPGAGSRRTREDANGQGEEESLEAGDDGAEAEETKWQRTG